jgi:hypothetical protein
MLQILAFKSEREELAQEYEACTAQAANVLKDLAALKEASTANFSRLRLTKAQTAKEDVRIYSASQFH